MWIKAHWDINFNLDLLAKEQHQIGQMQGSNLLYILTRTVHSKMYKILFDILETTNLILESEIREGIVIFLIYYY